MSELHQQNTYNLPLGYNDNRITIMARDPHWIYMYWEISNETKQNFYQNFGQHLWDKSVPVLRVTNISKNESFFVRINDFVKNWYINVPDSSCLYAAEIGRMISETFFIGLANSNYTTTPNECMDSNTTSYFINYKYLKNGKLDVNKGEIYESHTYKLHSQTISGLSSPELFGIDLEKSTFGVSSAQLFGIDIEKHLGISSEILMQKYQERK